MSDTRKLVNQYFDVCRRMEATIHKLAHLQAQAAAEEAGFPVGSEYYDGAYHGYLAALMDMEGRK